MTGCDPLWCHVHALPTLIVEQAALGPEGTLGEWGMAKNTTRRKFIGSTIASVGLLGVTAAANVAADKLSSLLDH